MEKGQLLENAFASVPSIKKVNEKRQAKYEAQKRIDDKLQAEKDAIEQKRIAEERAKEENQAKMNYNREVDEKIRLINTSIVGTKI